MTEDFQRSTALLLNQQKYAEAITFIKNIPNYQQSVACLNNLGIAYSFLGDKAMAMQAFTASINLDNNPAARFNLGMLYYHQKNYLLADEIFKGLVSVAAQRYDFCYYYAKTQVELKNYQVAEQWFLKASLCQPENPYLQHDVAYLYDQTGRFAASATILERELQRQDLPENLINLERYLLYFISLLLRNFKQAWELLLQLPLPQQPDSNYKPLKLWRGERDGALIFYPHEGIGDDLMYTCLLPLLQNRCPRIYWICDARVMDLFAHNFPAVCFVNFYDKPALQRAIDQCDYYVNGHHLMRQLTPQFDFQSRSFLQSLPGQTNFLPAKSKSFRIGISYSTLAGTAHNRMPPIEFWRTLFDLFPEVEFINLQENQQLSPDNRSFLFHQAELTQVSDIDLYNDFTQLSVLLQSLDLTITIDNYLAHLAGRVGVPFVLLLSKAHDWRWFSADAKSVWYPQATLIRQQVYAEWDFVLAELIGLLRHLIYKESVHA